MPRRSETPEEEAYEVEKIRAHKIEYDKKDRARYLFQVRWKGYAPEDDTWEPRENLQAGAESVLDDYVARLGKKGIKFWPEGTKRSVIEGDDKPVSRDSTASKTKKRESHTDEPSKKKAKKSLPPPSPSPPPPSTSRPKARPSAAAASSPPTSKSAPKASKPSPAAPSSRSSTKAIAVDIPDSEEEEQEPVEVVKASVAVAPVTSNGSTKKAAPEASIETTPPTGSELHKLDESWEHLLIVDALEQDETSQSGDYKWFVIWKDTAQSTSEWIPNEVGRRKFPQRCIDFYESHLRFKKGEEAMEED